MIKIIPPRFPLINRGLLGMNHKIRNLKFMDEKVSILRKLINYLRERQSRKRFLIESGLF